MNAIPLNEDNQKLFDQLTSLRNELDSHTLETYQRINPLPENLADWNEKGERFGGQDTVIYDSATLIGKVSIGAHCWVGPFTLLDGSASSGLTLGDYVVVASGTHIYTHDTVEWALSGGLLPYQQAPVTIGSCVFIGAQSTIVKGVSIGDHSLICANATVTTDVPPFSIVGGTPAKIIGEVYIENERVELKYFNK